MTVEFTVLGEVGAFEGERSVELGSPQQRALLSLLLLARGRTVLLDELIDQMWGPAAPGSARLVVRTYVTRLRRAFAGAGGSDPVILTLPSGYRVPGASEHLDLCSFEERVNQARAARLRGAPAEASRLLRSALSLWRGTALTGARGEFVHGERHRLEDLRLLALESRIRADLDLGLHDDLVAELAGLAASHPLREQLHEMLMLALYRCGRQADALAAFQHVRKLLDTELAVGPGPGLRRMQERILRGDPDLRPIVAEAPALGGVVKLPTPAQLPADIPDFVGRREPIARLVEMLEHPGGPNLCALHGLDGMGKTTLAVHVAHGLRSHYPDGQLYADLRGAGGRRIDPPAVLARFLRALGFAGELPRDLDERSALWRSYVSGRRLLLVLDDAVDSDQVRHLLPGSPESAAIVTSVRRMSDLPALQSLEVGPLTGEESADLLGTVVGRTRVDVEPEAFAGLLNISAGVPLALRTIGRHVAERRTWRIADVVRRLPHESSEIHDDAYRSIQEAVGHSEELVNPEVANALRVLRVVGVAAFDVESVAAMLDVSRTRALAILDSLTEVHLLERLPECRFEMLNPVRVFAGEPPRTPLRSRGRSAIA